MKTHFIFLDTETTGLKYPDPIEIAFIHIDTSKAQFLENVGTNDYSSHLMYDRWEQRYLPNKEIEQRAFEVHGISMDDLKGSPNCSTFNLHDKLLGENRRDEKIIMCGSYIQYDYRVLKKPPNIELFDTKDLTKLAFPSQKSHSLGKIFAEVMPEDSHHLLVDYHSAMGDCILAYYLVLEAMKKVPNRIFPEF